MPRCYMVKKGVQRHPTEGPPPCSPTEASVAPPCYSPAEEPRAAEYAELGRGAIAVVDVGGSADVRGTLEVGGTYDVGEDEDVGGTYDVGGPEDVGGTYEEDEGTYDEGEAEDVGGSYGVGRAEEMGGTYNVVRGEEVGGTYNVVRGEEVGGTYNVVRGEEVGGTYNVVRGEEVGGTYNVVRGEEVGGTYDVGEEDDERGTYDEGEVEDVGGTYDMGRTEEAGGTYELGRAEDQGSTYDGGRTVGVPSDAREEMEVEGAEEPMVTRDPPPCLERSAADTEAAHELLSLAQGLPPLPAQPSVLTVLDPAPMPVYTYTIQPTNIYILAEEPPEPVYTTVQTVQNGPDGTEYIDQQINYVYQPADEEPAPYVDHYEETVSEYEVHEVVQEVDVLEHQKQLELKAMQPPPHTVQVHRGGRPRREKPAKYDCPECGKRYATSSNLSRHKQTHRSLDSQAAKRCNECGKAYVSMPALAMHVLTHRMGHVCGVCGKQFSRPWLLRGHLRSHTGEKPYSCADCGKAFADRSNLRAHLQTHSSDKKYECERCNKSFALKSYLNKHQEATCVRADEDE